MKPKLLLLFSIFILSNFVGFAQSGLPAPIPISAFLNGNLPTTTPDVTGPTAPALLSQTGAFSDLTTLTPSPGIIPYDMIQSFWSDGAAKSRWMAVPNDGTHDTAAEQIGFSADGNWTMPIGGVLIKHFELGGQRLETRFTVHGSDGVYYFLTYKWNAAETDADLLTGSFDETVMVNGNPQIWHYPSRTECTDCHTPENGFVLGPKTRHLNKNITYPSTGINANQLVTLSSLGIITENITDANSNTYMALAAMDDLSATLQYRARSYIDVNCSSCHHPTAINGALFDARITTPLVDQNLIYGPVLYDEGLIDPKVVIPQDVPNSMMHHRMNSLEVGIAMPPLAKNVIDADGVQLIADWINSLTPATSFPPVASFAATPVFGTAPLLVNFDASASNDADGDPLTYTWDFGDGGTTLGLNPTYIFNTPGSYLVTLTVSDGTFSDITTTTITVNNSNPGSNVMTFTDATALLGTTPNNSGVAIAVSDMNADGKDDIIRYNQGNSLNIQYQGAPNQAFTSYGFGSVSGNNPWGTCVADYDNDGDNDIVLGGFYDDLKLLVNDNGNFVSNTIPNSNLFLQGINFADINNDGWSDIFACHDDAESKAFLNMQDGTYTYSPTLIATPTNPASDNSGNYASMWTDYDNDGDLDLYISKCRLGVSDPTDPRRINMLWQNDGNNNYTEVAAAANLKVTAQSWLSDFGDVDNDGDLDCIVINHYADCNLLLNDGTGVFTDVTATSGLLPTLGQAETTAYLGIQGLFRDFNNDGYIDIIYTGAKHFVFYNNGDGTFTQAPNPFNSNQIQSLAVGDLNSDGFLDVYAGYANGFNGPSSISDKLFLNDGNTNHHINIQLEGIVSNRNGIGARVEAYGVWGKQIREVRSGEGYGIHNSFTQHFGLGQATAIDSIVVRWPSGIIQTIDDINTIDQTLAICEFYKMPCDDGDICTFDDEYDETCTCVGIPSADADFDGVSDCNDQCPNSALGTVVDANGCVLGCTDPAAINYDSQAQVDDMSCVFFIDTDSDGVEDALDQCPNSAIGATVDANGCVLGCTDPVAINYDPQAQVDDMTCIYDADGDGVEDALDQCPNSATGATVDANGCVLGCMDTNACSYNPQAQVDDMTCDYSDTDNDGILDCNDACPNSAAGLTVDANGCVPGCNNPNADNYDPLAQVDDMSCVGSDLDGDGFDAPFDCDDTNATIYPGAFDYYDNGIDEDCDGIDPTIEACPTASGGPWNTFANSAPECPNPTVAPWQVWPNESYYVLAPESNMPYYFEFCDVYDSSVWEALITVRQYNRSTLTIGGILAAESGCYIEFSYQPNPDFPDLYIIVGDRNDCSGPMQQIDNGTPTFGCLPCEASAGTIAASLTNVCPNTPVDVTVSGSSTDSRTTLKTLLVDDAGIIVDMTTDAATSTFVIDEDCATNYEVYSYSYYSYISSPVIGTPIANIDCSSGCCELIGMNLSIEDSNLGGFDNPPADMTLPCGDNIPTMQDLAWSNCSNFATVVGTELDYTDGCSGGVIIRFWQYTDQCANEYEYLQSITVEPCTTPNTGPYNNFLNAASSCPRPITAPFEVWTNESYPVLALDDNTDYYFSFCDGYDSNLWEGFITILEHNQVDNTTRNIINSGAGCSITFNHTFDPAYPDVLILVQNLNACNENTLVVNNGIPSFGCVLPCPVTHNLTNQETGLEIYQASGLITSDQSIDVNADVIYNAGTCIELNPGFEVIEGAVFEAYIEGCPQ